MDQWLSETLRDTSAVAGTFTVWDVLIALMLSFALSLVLVAVYKHTHRGLSYSISFVHTIVIMAVTVSVIMLIIGSNLARAFALVGALSIIRFRTAVKDPKDVAFIFVAMAAGMACGVRLLVIAVIFVALVTPMIYFLHRFDVGATSRKEVLLKIHVPENLDYEEALERVFRDHLREHALLGVETVRGGTLLELVYSVQLAKGTDRRALLEALRAVNGNQRVSLLTGAQDVVL